MAIGSIAVVGIAAFAAVAWQPAIAPVARPDVDLTRSLIERGRAVVALGDCAVCHSPAGHRAFTGGLGLHTPFGVIYTTNISPDPATGIGQWSLAAFVRAMRKGVSRDGHLLYPAFPYIHYTKVTDDDLRAAYAFLMSQPAVQATAPDNELPLPLRFRPALAVWNLLYLDEGAVPAADGSAKARGRYLVDGLGHCSSCHTPLGIIGGEKQAEHLGGGDIEGWHAPALTELAWAPRPWTRQQLSDYLSGSLASDHGAAAGPMRPVTESLASVAPADVAAMAEYILTLQRSVPVPTTAAIVPASTAQVNRGRALFDGACAICHGPGSPMITHVGRPPLGLSSALYGPSPRNAIMTIMQGIPWPDGPANTQYMPAFADVLTDEQVTDVVAYLRSTVPGKPAWDDVEKRVAEAREELPK
ncbi:MAG TPA: cytochrome c [Luteibacter sp.]|uniref:cytochrome c n=1 Tax=Luteibacter sp. TaxID=1886636 RepID=UPI002B644B2D|nr:cytochrome c [Luteibacter sp.]HVI56010.1 cytochrome c [Luteibacter sp.]